MADAGKPRAETENPDPETPPMTVQDTMASSHSLRSSLDARHRDGRKTSIDFRQLVPERTDADIQKRYDMNDEAIGAGGYGKVFLAKDRRSGQKVAIKQVPKQKDTQKKQKLLSEVKIMMYLDHPNICRLLETYEKERYMYFVMECCEGGEVFDRIMDLERISERQCVDIVKQVASALKYAHTRGIAHRDLKPENVCFAIKDPESTLVKVIDWGLGFYFGQARMTSTVGSATYAAPEVLSGSQAEYGSECDLWSLGVLTYVMLSGKPPFWGSHNEQLRRMRAEQYPIKEAPWDSTSRAGKDFIIGLLKRNPDSRTPIDAVLGHEWLKSCDNQMMPEKDRRQVLANMQAFKNNSAFYSLCVTSVAKQLSHDSLTQVLGVFQDMDTNGDGVLELHEVKEGFEKLFGKGSAEAEQVEDMFEKLDLDGSGTIDYTEFCAAGIGQQTTSQESVLWAAFKSFDNADDNGEISAEELSKVLHKATAVQNAWTKEVCDEVAKEIISKFDADGNGTISFEEWLEMMQDEQIKQLRKEAAQEVQTKSAQELLAEIEKAGQDGDLDKAYELIRQMSEKHELDKRSTLKKRSFFHRLADKLESFCCCS